MASQDRTIDLGPIPARLECMRPSFQAGQKHAPQRRAGQRVRREFQGEEF